MVRAKFKVVGIEKNVDDLSTIRLEPVYSAHPESENGKFWKWTPAGNISLGTINPAAAAEFELGKEYYVDFTLAQ